MRFMNTKLCKNKTAIVAFRIHQEIKEKVNRILTQSGLDTSTVLNMVMQKYRYKRKITHVS